MDRESKLFGENIEHPVDVISKYDIIPDQLDMRIDLVLKVLMEHDLKPENMYAAIGRGGMLLYIRWQRTLRTCHPLCIWTLTT